MDMELDEAIKHNKIIITVIQKDLAFERFRDHAHETIEYNDLKELYGLLHGFNFNF